MKNKQRITFLSDDSLTALWLTFEERWNDPAWQQRIFWAMLLLSTGMRIEEATRLPLDACTDSVIEIHDGKGHKDRDVEVDLSARPFVAWYLRRQIRAGKTFLFPGQRRPKGVPDIRPCVSTRKARDWWRDVLALADVPYISPHGARRTFITWNAERMSLPDMQQQVGHEDWKTTRAHYFHSIAGRRFEKPKPQWLFEAERISEEFKKRGERHLRVVGA